MEKVKISIWGFGAMGQGVVECLLPKKGIEITGICDINPNIVGKGMYEVLGQKFDQPDVIITDDIQKALSVPSDICILGTDSFTKNSWPKIETILNAGVNIITTAEEMAYPTAGEPELSKKIDALAKEKGVSVLGTGINPGLVMDLLALVLSGAMTNVDSVLCRRVNSLSPFGPTVMEEQGVGMPLDEFNKKMEAGTMAGHVGFAESVNMIADGMGIELDGFEQQMKPIVTDIDRKSPHGFAPAGHVTGVDMTAKAQKTAKLLLICTTLNKSSLKLQALPPATTSC